MKAISNQLINFIIDFDLQTKDDIVCFNAIIYFTTISRAVQISSEVQIITIDGKSLDIIYLLNPAVEKHGIPDMYEEASNQFIYLKNRSLILKGKSLDKEDFVLSIHPGSKSCDKKTLAEIHGKMYN